MGVVVSGTMRWFLAAAGLSTWLMLLVTGNIWKGSVHLLLLVAILVIPWSELREVRSYFSEPTTDDLSTNDAPGAAREDAPTCEES